VEALGKLAPDALEGTKRRILRIAGTLFSERSYLGVSMSDIAKRLGITKPALYYHFPSKMDLYSMVLDGVLDGLRAVINEAAHAGDPAAQLRYFVKKYLDFGMRERNLVNAVVVRRAPDHAEYGRRVAAFRQELAAQVCPIVRETIKTSRLPRDTDAAGLTKMLMALMDGLLFEYSCFEEPIDDEQVADQIIVSLGLRDRSAEAAPCSL